MTFATEHTSTPHTLRFQQQGSGDTYYITTYDASNAPCWFQMKLTARNLARLKQTTREQRIDLTQYGTVLASGWGHTPPSKR